MIFLRKRTKILIHILFTDEVRFDVCFENEDRTMKKFPNDHLVISDVIFSGN